MRQHPILVRGFLCPVLVSYPDSAPAQSLCPVVLDDRIESLLTGVELPIKKEILKKIVRYLGICSVHGLQMAREASDPIEGLSQEELEQLQLLYDLLKDQQGEVGSAKPIQPDQERTEEVREHPAYLDVH